MLAQQAGGLSVRGWCRAHNCPEHGFYWWRANLGLSSASKRRRRQTRKPAAVAFTRVVVESPAPPVAAPMRLTFAGGRELALPASMPVEQVARLLRAIEAADVGAA